MGKGQEQARVQLYTGEGEGKTTNAFGLALRAFGQGKKVIIVQFMKGRKDIGEVKAIAKLGKFAGGKISLKQFGRKEFISPITNPQKKDFELAEKGMQFAFDSLKQKPGLLILDEINLACYAGLVEEKQVLELLAKAPERMIIVLTGRRAPQKLIDAADLVTEFKEIKHPFAKGIQAVKGIEY
ncbi:cob(I)yrinic acid a,c-diamide adenosyltransferase [archaeon]|nr:cob(I)yrinic acid a,c-diamide adenosyltransferase [archaeon]